MLLSLAGLSSPLGSLFLPLAISSAVTSRGTTTVSPFFLDLSDDAKVKGPTSSFLVCGSSSELEEDDDDADADSEESPPKPLSLP